MPKNRREWLSEDYFAYLTAQLTASVSYLHQSITWGIGVVTLVAGAIFSGSTSAQYGFYASLLGGVLLIHFAFRAARGYANIMRFSRLLRSVTFLNTHDTQDPLVVADIEKRICDNIQNYHYDWKLPVSMLHIYQKVLFGFGFGFMAAGLLLVGFLSYGKAVSSEAHLPSAVFIFILVAGFIIALEHLGSEYFKERKPYPIDS